MGIAYQEILQIRTIDALFLIEAKMDQQKNQEQSRKKSQKIGDGYYLDDFVPEDFDISKWEM